MTSLEAFLDAVQATLHELGVPGISLSPAVAHRLARLHEAGAPLDLVLHAMVCGFRERITRGQDVRSMANLMPAIEAATRRAGIPTEGAR